MVTAVSAGASTRPHQFERAVLAELNRARAKPAEYARDLHNYRSTIRGRIAYEHGSGVGTITEEGVAAVDEAIAFLKSQPALPALNDSDLLGLAARGLVAEQARTGHIGHVTRGGRDPGARVRAHGGGSQVAEAVAYGFDAPAAAVRQLIVDDGVRDRGHRRLVFSRQFRFAGVGCATHPYYRRACAIDYAATARGGSAPVRLAGR